MIFIGFLSGIFVTMVAMVYVFRNHMITTKELPYDLQTSISLMEKSIKTAGWGIPTQLNVNKMTAEKGVALAVKIHIIELCKPEYAKHVLESAPAFSAMMPCRIGLFEQEGKTFVSKMNTGMMSMILGGIVGKTMKKVAKEEENILKTL